MPSAPSRLEDVRSALERHADNPSAFLALNTRTEYFRADGLDGVIAYRTAGRRLVQFGGPFAAEEDRAPLLAAFQEHARTTRRKLMAVQLQCEDAELYATQGFTVNQIGASYAIDLARFTLRGSKFVRLRNKISRAKRSGLVVAEADPLEVDAELTELDRDWLRGKGRFAKELAFLIGERTGEAAPLRRLFVGRIEGEVIGYISYSPVYGTRPGWLHDLTRRRREAPPGVMEAINAQAVQTFCEDGAGWLHLGFTPFTGLDPQHEVASASPMVAKVVRFLAEHGEKVYPSATQVAYKEKWDPHTVLPEYLAFDGGASLGAILGLMRLTNAI
ncbi:bifunctional lysylphosphatidylglycerol flippase/synthetase MprF [Kitasatospora sp. NPDC101183]|uniref:bifunctional lysylphosphatidylglycerol flippase/synthetase MprF n=1 Tax=Kitasatospora sp. NPDC101183 TaxID=3364100 RepID=UPI0038227661